MGDTESTVLSGHTGTVPRSGRTPEQGREGCRLPCQMDLTPSLVANGT